MSPFKHLLCLLSAATLLSGTFFRLQAQEVTLPTPSESSSLPDAPDPVGDDGQQTGATPQGGKQTSRILGIIPNFRSVSADTKLPPESTKEKLVLTLQDSFDYSSFIFVGILAGISQSQNSYPQFHQGAPGYARYYWHSFADNVNGNLMTEFIVPTVTKEDPRYYTKGHGGVVKRTAYSVSRLLITRTDAGDPTPNFSEVVGNGAAAGLSTLYYPSSERTWTKTGQKWITQIGIDGFSNLVKEFWPDINDHIFHTH